MSEWKYLNRHRVRTAMFATNDSDGCNGAFCLMLNGKKVKVIASDGMGWKQVSVSFHDTPTFTPSWEIMCRIKDLFWEPEDVVVQFHPAKSDYVNQHPGCLHLWQ